MHVDHEHAALPYLKRIPGLAADALRSCYTDATVWENFDPALMTLCSPDPQAFRPPDEKINVLQVTLADQLQGRALRVRRAYRDAAPDGRPTSRRSASTAGDGRSSCRSSSRCTIPLRAAREMGDAADRQLSLRPEDGRAFDSRKPCTAISRPRARSTIGCASCA